MPASSGQNLHYREEPCGRANFKLGRKSQQAHGYREGATLGRVAGVCVCGGVFLRKLWLEEC